MLYNHIFKFKNSIIISHKYFYTFLFCINLSIVYSQKNVSDTLIKYEIDTVLPMPVMHYPTFVLAPDKDINYPLNILLDSINYHKIKNYIIRVGGKDSICFIEKTTPKDLKRHAFYIYICFNKQNIPQLYMRIQYAADEWLLIDHIHFITENTNLIFKKRYFDEIKRDNTNGLRWEWIDRLADQQNFEQLKTISLAKQTKIVFEGIHFTNYRNITSNEKRSLIRMLNLYQLLNGDLK